MNVFKLITPYKLDLFQCKNKYIVIDCGIIYRFTLGMINSKEYIIDDKGIPISEIYVILQLYLKFKSLNITPIFVFDGKTPKIKENTVKKRSDIKNVATKKLEQIIDINKNINNEKNIEDFYKLLKQSFRLNFKNIEYAKTILHHMGVPIIESYGEADSQCAVISNYYPDAIIGVLTDDSDPLLYGATRIIKIEHLRDRYVNVYTLKDTITHINKLCMTNKITRTNLIEIDCMIGNDICPNIKSDFNSVLKFYISNNLSIDNINSEDLTNAINTYLNTNVYKYLYDDLHSKSPNINTVKKMLCPILNEFDIEYMENIMKGKIFKYFKLNMKNKISIEKYHNYI